MTTKIRVVTSLSDAEIQRLGEMLVAVVEAGASVGYLPPLDASVAQQYWRGVCKPEVLLLLAEVDGEIAGTVQLELATKANARHRAEVNRLLVDPKYQRQGLGRVLMEALESEAKVLGRTLLHLDTREGDTSNDFYRSQGWTEAGMIPMWARSSGGSLDGTVFYYKVLE
ncbi:MAG: GNAT family N-acetyltransferase [Thermomicrobiales bacterium]|nr:GNAT family N-acetyltransferase [Thermomicrobiales bacterium]